jgi:hypothetical protein
VVNGYKTDKDADRTPQQISHFELDRHILFAVAGAGRFLEFAFVF